MFKKYIFTIFLSVSLLQFSEKVFASTEDNAEEIFDETSTSLEDTYQFQRVCYENKAANEKLIEAINNQSDNITALLKNLQTAMGNNSTKIKETDRKHIVFHLKKIETELSDKIKQLTTNSTIINLLAAKTIIKSATSKLQKLITNQHINTIDSTRFLQSIHNLASTNQQENATILENLDNEYLKLTKKSSLDDLNAEEQFDYFFKNEIYKSEQISTALKEMESSKSEIQKLDSQATTLGLTLFNVLFQKSIEENAWFPTIKKSLIYSALFLGSGYFYLKYSAPMHSTILGVKINSFLDKQYSPSERSFISEMINIQNNISRMEKTVSAMRRKFNLKIIKKLDQKKINELQQNLEYLSNLEKEFNNPSLIKDLLSKITLPAMMGLMIKEKFGYPLKKFVDYMASWIPIEKDVDLLAQKKDKASTSLYEWARGGPVRNNNNGLFSRKENDGVVIGQDTLQDLQQQIIDLYNNHKKYERLGLNRNYGILLYGQPQTGKTYFTQNLKRNLEREINKDVEVIEVTTRFITEIESIFKYAQNQTKPCVIFLDELDKLIADPLVLKALLSSMTDTSGTNPYPVIVVAGTNHAEKLPDSLRSAGRFNVMLPVERPSFNHRIEFIHQLLKEQNTSAISPSFIETIAKETNGYSFADLRNMVEHGARLALNSHQNKLLKEHHLRTAFNTTIRGILAEVESNPQEDAIAAIYHTSTAVMRNILDTETSITCLTIKPVIARLPYNPTIADLSNQNDRHQVNKQFISPVVPPLTYHGRTFTASSLTDKSCMSKEEIKKEILVRLAGQTGLKLLLKSSYPEFNREDNAECFNTIKRLITKGEEETASVKKEVKTKHTHFKKEALKILLPHQGKILLLAYLLEQQKTLESNVWESCLQRVNDDEQATRSEILQNKTEPQTILSKMLQALHDKHNKEQEPVDNEKTADQNEED